MDETDMKQEKFRQACEDHRFFGDMRFKQLTLFTAVMAALLTALLTKEVQISDLDRAVLYLIGLGFTSVLWVMEIRSTIHGDKSSAIIEALGNQKQYFGVLSQPFNATNAVFVLYSISYFGWTIVLGRIANSGWVYASWAIGAFLLSYTILEYLPLWKHRTKSGVGGKQPEPRELSMETSTQPPESNHETFAWRPDQTPLWKVTLEVGAVFVGFVVAIIYLCELRAMIRANEISRDNLVSAQRAFVSFSPEIQPYYVSIKEGSPKIASWEFQIPVRNSGTTPTHQLQDHVFIKSMPNTLPDNFDFQDFEEGHPAFIAPQDHISYVTDTVSVDDVNHLKAGTKHLYVYGWARYRDAFAGTPIHVTQFCYELHATEGNFSNTKGPWITRATLCSIHHNCSDDECAQKQ